MEISLYGGATKKRKYYVESDSVQHLTKGKQVIIKEAGRALKFSKTVELQDQVVYQHDHLYMEGKCNTLSNGHV
jgi:hypothetical protein